MSQLSPNEKAALRKNAGVQFGTDRLLAAPGDSSDSKSVMAVVAAVLVVLIIGTIVALSTAT